MSTTASNVLKKLQDINKAHIYKANHPVGIDTLALIFNSTTTIIDDLLTQLQSENLIEINAAKGGKKFVALTEKGGTALA